MNWSFIRYSPSWTDPSSGILTVMNWLEGQTLKYLGARKQNCLKWVPLWYFQICRKDFNMGKNIREMGNIIYVKNNPDPYQSGTQNYSFHLLVRF
jgi:hypothetical protein